MLLTGPGGQVPWPRHSLQSWEIAAAPGLMAAAFWGKKGTKDLPAQSLG